MLGRSVALIRGLPPTVRLLLLGTLVNKLGSFIVPYLTLVLRREFALSAGRLGAIVAAYGVGSIVSLLVGGAITDRLGRRAALLLSLFGSGVLAIALAWAPNLHAFVLLLVLFGFLADLYRPAAAAIIGDLLPSAERAIGFAALRLAVNLGFAVSMTLGGVFADWNWRLLFIGDGATTLLYGTIVLFLIGETRVAGGAGALAHAAPASPLRDGTFLLVSASSLVFCTLIFVDFSVLPLTVTLSAGYPAVVFGMLVGSNGLLIALFELPLVDALRGRRRLRVAAVGMALSAVGFGMVGFVMHWSWFLASVLLWTAGEILVVPQQNAFIVDWAPPEARGRYLGLYQATWSLGLALSPPLFLPLHERLGERAFWPLLTLLALPTVAVLLYLDRTADHPELLRGARGAALGEPALAVEARG